MVYKIYFEMLMPFLGKHIFHRGEFNSFQYLPESNRFFPNPKTLAQILNDCGIERIQTYDHMMGIITQQVGYVKEW
jgi:ubiquinone/menaquinone biosynthesis C-methylase UbiE